MAISGDISDLPLTDLLNMIRFRGGIVTLTDTPRVGEMVLYFSPGFVTGFSIEKQNIKVESQVVDRLVAVAAVPVGKFHYEPAPAASLRGSVRIPVDRLALKLVSKVDEININRDALPSALQVFRLRDESAAIGDIAKQVVEPDIANFVREARQLLHPGVSAARIAELNQIGVEVARLYLYKLNLLSATGMGPLRLSRALSDSPTRGSATMNGVPPSTPTERTRRRPPCLASTMR